jgi:hypothetical protein
MQYLCNINITLNDKSKIGLADAASLQLDSTNIYFFYLLKGPAADATDAQQPWRPIVQPYEEDDKDDEVFSAFTV